MFLSAFGTMNSASRKAWVRLFAVEAAVAAIGFSLLAYFACLLDFERIGWSAVLLHQ